MKIFLVTLLALFGLTACGPIIIVQPRSWPRPRRTLQGLNHEDMQGREGSKEAKPFTARPGKSPACAPYPPLATAFPV